MVDPPAWQRRFTAPQVGFPAWNDSAPDHLAFVSNESGIWQAWSADRASGGRRRVTDESVGVEEVMVAPDGRLVWWQDDVGDETGRWMSATPDGSDAHPLVLRPPDRLAPRDLVRRDGGDRARDQHGGGLSGVPHPARRSAQPPPQLTGPHRGRSARSGRRRRDLGRRSPDLPQALRARRHHPRGPACRRRVGRDGRRTGRRGLEPRPRRVEPRAGRSSIALHVGARTVRSDPRSGTSRPAIDATWTSTCPGP